MAEINDSVTLNYYGHIAIFIRACLCLDQNVLQIDPLLSNNYNSIQTGTSNYYNVIKTERLNK